MNSNVSPHVFAVRCTQKLLLRLGVPASDASVPPDTVLGDWYANLCVTKPAHLILCVSERSLLPVVVEARNPSGFPVRLAVATGAMLAALGVPQPLVESECTAMERLYLTKSESKSMLGSLNDTMLRLRDSLADRPEYSLLEHSLYLAGFPSKPLGFKFASEATRALFAEQGASHAKS